MPNFLVTLWGLLNSFVTYEGLTPLILAVTLWFIFRYTKATKGLAEETKRLAETTAAAFQIEKDSFEIRKRPVISIGCAMPWSFEVFRPKVASHAGVHAWVRVRATLVVGDKIIRIPESSHYGGTVDWQIQAYSTITGVLNITEPEDLPRGSRDLKVHIIFEHWAINYYDDKSEIDDDSSKGPLVEYYWDPTAPWPPELTEKLDKYRSIGDPTSGWWVLEASPKDPPEISQQNSAPS